MNLSKALKIRNSLLNFKAKIVELAKKSNKTICVSQAY